MTTLWHHLQILIEVQTSLCKVDDGTTRQKGSAGLCSSGSIVLLYILYYCRNASQCACCLVIAFVVVVSRISLTVIPFRFPFTLFVGLFLALSLALHFSADPVGRLRPPRGPTPSSSSTR